MARSQAGKARPKALETQTVAAPTRSKLTADFLASRHMLVIGGAETEGATNEALQTFDPALGTVLGAVPHAGKADVDAAVTAAQSALAGAWARTPPAERARLLMRLAELIERDADWISEVESLDSGKPKAYIAAVDVPLSTGALRYYAGWCTKVAGETIPVSSPDMHV